MIKAACFACLMVYVEKASGKILFAGCCIVSCSIYVIGITIPLRAGVAELVDALDSKSSGGDIVRVRFSPPAPFI